MATDTGRIIAQDSQARFAPSTLPEGRAAFCIRPLRPKRCAPYFGAPNALIAGHSRAARSALNQLIVRREGLEWHELAGLFGFRQLRGLTFELSGRQRQDASARAVKMYRVPPTGRWRPAVGAPLERRVRPHMLVQRTPGPAALTSVLNRGESACRPVPNERMRFGR